MYKEIGPVFMLTQAYKVVTEIFDVVWQKTHLANGVRRIRRK